MGKTPDHDAAHPERRTVEIDSRVLTELAHWATIGLESGYETSKAMRIASLERARRECGTAFTLTDLHEASRRVRESAETVRETIEHLVHEANLPGISGHHPLRSGDPHATEGVSPELPEIVVDAVCTACEDDVDPLTGRHLRDADACLHEKVPGRLLDVRFACPVCGGGDISEVNIGEIWDEVTAVALDGATLTVTVDQLSEMDRNGDGWLCTSCLSRLALPAGYEIAFEYV
jgi:hypothetical protein